LSKRFPDVVENAVSEMVDAFDRLPSDSFLGSKGRDKLASEVLAERGDQGSLE